LVLISKVWLLMSKINQIWSCQILNIISKQSWSKMDDAKNTILLQYGILGSWSSADGCSQSIPLIDFLTDTWLTMWSYLVDTQSTFDQQPVDSRLSANWLIYTSVENKLIPDWLLTAMSIKGQQRCQLSMLRVSIERIIDTRLWLTVHMICIQLYGRQSWMSKIVRLPSWIESH